MKIIVAPDQKLRIQTKRVKKITPGLLATITEMVKLTKTFVDPEGVGLASTQIGLGEQFFVAKVPNYDARGDGERGAPARSRRSEATRMHDGAVSRQDPKQFIAKQNTEQFITVINPKILSTGKRTKKYLEGCLSIPNYYGEINRFTNIKVSYQDQTGIQINANLKGILAWIFQHEMDHLSGILFPDRVLEQKGKFYKVVGKDKAGADIFEEITL